MKKSKRKTTIARRILLMISLLIFVGMSTGLGLGYYAGYNLIENIVGDSRRQTAQLLSQSLSEAISEKIRDIRTYLGNPEFMNAILESNFRYAAMDIGLLQDYFKDIDKKWAEAAAGDTLMKGHLDTAACASLERLAGMEETIGEIFLTDRYGGLVASSDRTSDFYQADEEWWLEAFAGGKGKFFIGDIEYDLSSGVWGVPFVIPIRDEGMNLQGICKAVVAIDAFFAPLDRFRIGKTGHAALVDSSGYILFHHDVKPASIKMCGPDEFAGILDNKKGWGIVNTSFIHRESLFTAFARVEHPILLDRGIIWRIFIEQDAKEVFAPLNIYLLQGAALALLLIVILLPSSFLLSKKLAMPIIELREAAEHVAGGDLDYPIYIKTGDEIGELAVSFKRMISSIKEKQDEIMDAKAKLEEWSQVLEKRVDERTRELSESQKAMQNMMQDLQDAYNKLKETQSQLLQAEKMEAVGRMASGIAHEVKNPLGIILQGIDYIEPRLSEDSSEIIRVIKSNIKRADNIVSSLVDFSRLSSLNIVAEDINSILESSLVLIQHRAKLEDIEIIKQLGRGLPKVSADRLKIEQVFINILLNAVAAMKNGGKIYIRTYKKRFENIGFRVGRRKKDGDFFAPGEEAVAVEIEDTGCGIKQDELKKVFDPFFTTKEIGEGTGLGLSVAKNIIDLHRGIIDVTSKAGAGSKFTVIIKTAKTGG